MIVHVCMQDDHIRIASEDVSSEDVAVLQNEEVNVLDQSYSI